MVQARQGFMELFAAADRRCSIPLDLQVGVIPTRTIDHPLVGPMQLRPERLAIVMTDRQLLIVWHAEPGSPSERALARLADLAAGNNRQHAFKARA